MKKAMRRAGTSKTILLLALLTFLFFSTSVVLTSYPQHLYISNSTKIDVVKFLDGNKLLLKGNMVQYGAGDVIPLEGNRREYIRITGRQTQIAGNTYKEGIRSITSDASQNVLFSQTLGAFNESDVAQIVIENTVINLIPISRDVINVNVQNLDTRKLLNNYNIHFTQATTYTNDNRIMLQLTKKKEKVYVSLVGIKPYKNILFRAG